jgi:hypothetical protein
MNKLRKSVLTSLGLLPFLMPMDIGAAEQNKSTEDLFRPGEETPWKKARFSIEVQTGSRTIGALDALIPFMGNDDFLVYTDLMAKIGTGAKNKNGNTWEGNIGLGVRRVNDSETAIYGAYAFYDHLKSVNDNMFSQITIGAERLGLVWDFRANAYLPIGTKQYTKDNYTKVIIDQHNLIEYYKSTTEVATAGGDVEVGRTLGSQKLRGYLAAYSFGKDLTGPRVRFEYQLNDHFALNAAVQYDKDRGTQYFLGARFSVGGAKAKNSNSIYSRLTDQVVRDIDVVTTETSINSSKVAYDKFWVVDADQEGSGDGTIDNPYRYLDDAIEKAPEGAIIFVKGRDGSLNPVRDNLTLKDGQILWGGDQSLYWDFNRDTPAYAPGDNVVILKEGEGVRQSLGGGIEMANNSSIYNFDIVADDANFDNAGIYINNKHNVVIDNITISNFKSGDSNNPYSGIYVTGADSSASFKNVTLNNNDIGIFADSGITSFKDISITNSGTYGMNISNATVNANNIMIDQSGISGVTAENTIFNANNLTINNSLQGSGYYQHGGSANFTGDVSIDNSAQSGVYLDNVNFAANKVTISNSTQFGVSQHGGSFTANGGVDIQNSGEDGFFVENGVVTIKGDSNLSTNGNNVQTENHGAGLYALNSEINIASLSANENTADGIYLENSHIISNAVTTDNNQHSGIVFEGNKDNQQSFIGTISSNANNVGTGVSLNNSKLISNTLNATENLYGVYLNNSELTIAEGGDISSNGAVGMLVDGAQSNLIMSGTTLNNNVEHGLQLNHGSTATITDVTVTGNGVGDLADAHNLDELMSGIQITDGTLNATHITVEGNAGGIEIIKGALNINNGATLDDQTSTINNNSGYGVYAHGTDAPSVNISNTQINNTQSVANVAESGYGLYANNANAINLQQIQINENAAGGIKAFSDTSAVDLTIVGGEIRGNNGAGIDVAGMSTDINLTSVQVAHNQGAGITATSQTSNTFTASDLQVNDNTADGVKLTANDAVDIDITQSKIDNNGVTKDAEGNIISRNGGGIVANSANSTVNANISGSQVNANGLDGVKLSAHDTVTINATDHNKFDNNGANGISAISTDKNVDVTVSDSEVNGNAKDGLHFETQVFSEQINTVNLTNVDIKNNSGYGISGLQRSMSTSIFTFNGVNILGNRMGLYISNGTLTGTKRATSLQDNNDISNINREGDFVND